MRTGMIVVAGLLAAGSAADWPQFRADAERSGYTSASLPSELSPQWVREAPTPDAAWVGQDTRLPFDHAYHVVIADGTLFYGSSADCKVYALDAATGEERWSVFTDGPVRLAPAVWRDRVFVAGDDGHLYCFAAKTGDELWKMRPGPTPDMLLGNGRITSRWPVRGGPVIADDVLYFAAGIWPSEGIYLLALDPETGDVIWQNDTAGFLEMDQPHGGARAKSGISAQGYLTVAGDALLVPTGRAVPAAFSRKDGSFRYFHLQAYSGRGGGPYIASVDDWFLSELDVFLTDAGTRQARGVPSAAMAAMPSTVVWAYGKQIKATKRSGLIVQKDGVDKRGNPIKQPALGEPRWTVDAPGAVGQSLIAAGSTVVAAVAGAEGSQANQVVMIDTGSKELGSALDVDGKALGLAAAGGRLYVSTGKGTIYCFGEGTAVSEPLRAAGREIRPTTAVSGLETRPTTAGEAAEEIIEKTGISKGWCVDLGCGEGELAQALADRTELKIIGIEPDAAKVAAARERLHAAGLYGTRVTVLQRKLNDTWLPNSLANLVVSSQSLTGRGRAPKAEVERLQRPYGGMACTGKPGEMTVDTRGALAGAGEWTHQYAAPGGPGASTDDIVKGPLAMLWFADNTLEMPSRHGRGPSPLFWNGILVVEGIHGIRAVDAYNGTQLWEVPLPNILKAYDQEHLNGAAITGSNICIADGSLYVRLENRCLRLDVETGEKLGEFTAPPRPDGEAGVWGYITVEGGTLYGSLYDTGHQVTFAFGKSDMSQLFSESILLFAMDAKTGDVKWTYTPEHSVRNNTITVGRGSVFLIDRAVATRDRAKDDKTEHPPGKLVALDAETGTPKWETADDIYGTMLSVSEEHGVLLMAYQSTRFQLSSEAGGRMSGIKAADGTRLWEVKEKYGSRPLMNGRTIYAQPGAWDLMTGERLPFNLTRSYGCGTLAASKHLIAYRSATLGYWDLTTDRGTENYGGIRPGCWINVLPVGGLLLSPETSNRCVCSYLIKATIALQPHGLRAPKLEPATASSNEPISVALTPDEPKAQVRYTLDGSSPTMESPRYGKPIRVAQTATLNARAFMPGMAPSQMATGSFTVDPDIIPLDAAEWKVYDTPGAGPPQSQWVIANGVASEMSNHYLGEAANFDPLTDRPGTYRAHEAGGESAEGELTLELSCADDDGLGVAFRFADREHHYLLALDKQRAFRVLARKNGDDYQVLAQNDKGYVSNRWYEVKVVLDGAKLTVTIDGEREFEVEDDTFGTGTFALYSWGSTGARFRNVKWKAK